MTIIGIAYSKVFKVYHLVLCYAFQSCKQNLAQKLWKNHLKQTYNLKTTHGREKTVQVRRHSKWNAIDMATQSRHFTPNLIILSLLHIITIANETTPKTLDINIILQPLRSSIMSSQTGQTTESRCLQLLQWNNSVTINASKPKRFCGLLGAWLDLIFDRSGSILRV